MKLGVIFPQQEIGADPGGLRDISKPSKNSATTTSASTTTS